MHSCNTNSVLRRDRRGAGLLPGGTPCFRRLVIVVPPQDWAAVAMSRSDHGLTLGEAGRLNYAWLVQRGIPLHAGWIGDSATAIGTPIHPPRLIFRDPEVLE